MGLILAAIWFFVARRAGQLHWKHGLWMVLWAVVIARGLTYTQGTSPLGPFVIAMVAQFAGYGVGIFFAKPKSDE